MKRKSPEVEVKNKTRRFKVFSSAIKQLCAYVLKAEGKKINAAFSIAFVGESTMRKLNYAYRGKNGATNVLSFVLNEEVPSYVSTMEIVLCPQMAFREAMRLGNEPNDYVCFLLIHGILHCIGYDHESEDDKKVMERVEEEIFRVLPIRRIIYKEGK